VYELLRISFIQLSSEMSFRTFITGDKMSSLTQQSSLMCVCIRTMASVTYVIEVLLSIFVASETILGYLNHIIR